MQAAYKLRGGAWTRLRYVGQRSDQSTPLAPYAELDASLWGRIYRDMRVAFRIDNVTDERYALSARLSAFGRGLFVTLDALWQ